MTHAYLFLYMKDITSQSSIFEMIASVVAPDGPIASMANAAAILKAERDYYFWVGFYLVEGNELTLGPFQGPVACSRIAYGRGVCGTAWREARTIIVSDVDQFPGHIACNAASRSEIVVPLNKQGRIVGVLDVDSTQLDAFHAEDAVLLERVAQLIADKIK